MTRDEAILSALLAGHGSTVELATATGMTERVCRYGLRHLINEDYVWSPERGRYRLTRRGRVLAAEIIPDDGPPSEASGATPAPVGADLPRRSLFGRSR